MPGALGQNGACTGRRGWAGPSRELWGGPGQRRRARRRGWRVALRVCRAASGRRWRFALVPRLCEPLRCFQPGGGRGGGWAWTGKLRWGKFTNAWGDLGGGELRSVTSACLLEAMRSLPRYRGAGIFGKGKGFLIFCVTLQVLVWTGFGSTSCRPVGGGSPQCPGLRSPYLVRLLIAHARNLVWRGRSFALSIYLKTRMPLSSSVVIYLRRMEKDVPVLPQSLRRKMGIYV